jgi:HSP20 family molecular chaperone IbpA
MEKAERTHQDVLDATAATEAAMAPQKVPVNVYETTSALVILAVMPAVTPGDVEIELRPGILRFWAGVRSAGNREYLVKEWEYGGYEREIDIPSGYGSAVEATMANGQLAIRVLRGESTETITAKPSSSGP